MRVTQGAFSFLPDLSDQQIHEQVQYCIDQNWAVSIEYTDDPHPRNVYWEMWDDNGRIATIRKVNKIYVGEFEHYKLKHRTKKNAINHIKLILKLRRDSINNNEHAA